MTPTRAGELFRLLRAAYPAAKLTQDTAELWLTELRRLDDAIGTTAVQSLIARSTFWPSIAELNEQVQIARDQAARMRRDAERRDADLIYDQLPRIPLREIPAAVELLGRFAVRPLNLDRADDGLCDDCRTAGARYRHGRVQVCADCGGRRLRAAERLAGEPTDEAA